MKSRISILLALLSAVFLFPEFSSAQITADSIAAQMSRESGNPAEGFATYSQKLAKLLHDLPPAARARVLGGAASVLLNDQLGLDEIGFAHQSANLTSAATAELDKVADFLKENPDTKIKIDGHTALAFSGAQALSEARAMAAKMYLQRLGINPDRIESSGYSNTKPLVSGTSADAQTQNRRIEITLQ